jgi:hypothetical protein
MLAHEVLNEDDYLQVRSSFSYIMMISSFVEDFYLSLFAKHLTKQYLWFSLDTVLLRLALILCPGTG